VREQEGAGRDSPIARISKTTLVASMLISNAFRQDTCRLLEKHGAKIVGLWTAVGDYHKEEVAFMAAYEREEHMRRVTAAWQPLSRWQTVSTQMQDQDG
jgi:hypothetical protein